MGPAYNNYTNETDLTNFCGSAEYKNEFLLNKQNNLGTISNSNIQNISVYNQYAQDNSQQFNIQYSDRNFQQEKNQLSVDTNLKSNSKNINDFQVRHGNSGSFYFNIENDIKINQQNLTKSYSNDNTTIKELKPYQKEQNFIDKETNPKFLILDKNTTHSYSNLVNNNDYLNNKHPPSGLFNDHLNQIYTQDEYTNKNPYNHQSRLYNTNNVKILGLNGINNYSNTCFMNSALQCLSNIPNVKSYFLDGELSYRNQMKKHQHNLITNEFCSILSILWGSSFLAASTRELKVRLFSKFFVVELKYLSKDII